MCLKHEILATLTYFDIFKYPITQTEIFLFLQKTYCLEEFTKAIRELLSDGAIFKFDDFYTLQNDYELILRRRKGNQMAKKIMETAEKVASLLSAFPFVRGVAISGSLSKNYADENSDIDLFIITKKNRLWLARTFLHLFKKCTYLFKKQHLFCMNYFIDEAGLQIKEKNIYTATEVATLLPLRGIESFIEFYKSNDWCKEYLPNHTMRISYNREIKRSIMKRIIEFVFDNLAGTAMDDLFMNITARRWKKKTQVQKRNAKGNIMGMDANKHYAKPDPVNFQEKFMDIYQLAVRRSIHQYEQRLKPVC